MNHHTLGNLPGRTPPPSQEQQEYSEVKLGQGKVSIVNNVSNKRNTYKTSHPKYQLVKINNPKYQLVKINNPQVLWGCGSLQRPVNCSKGRVLYVITQKRSVCKKKGIHEKFLELVILLIYNVEIPKFHDRLTLNLTKPNLYCFLSRKQSDCKEISICKKCLKMSPFTYIKCQNLKI